MKTAAMLAALTLGVGGIGAYAIYGGTGDPSTAALIAQSEPAHEVVETPLVTRQRKPAWLIADDGAQSVTFNFCDTLISGDKVGAWTCFNGNGTFQGISLTKSGTDLDASSTCNAGALTTPARNPNASAIWNGTTTRIGGADYTTCALVKPSSGSGEQALLTWSVTGQGSDLGISPWIGADGTTYNGYYSYGIGCGSATVFVAPLTPNAQSLVCTRVSASSSTLDYFINGVKTNITTVGVNIGCNPGNTITQYHINSWSGVAPQPNTSAMYGAFATETALSDARITALNAALLTCNP